MTVRCTCMCAMDGLSLWHRRSSSSCCSGGHPARKTTSREMRSATAHITSFTIIQILWRTIDRPLIAIRQRECFPASWCTFVHNNISLQLHAQVYDWLTDWLWLSSSSSHTICTYWQCIYSACVTCIPGHGCRWRIVLLSDIAPPSLVQYVY